MAECKSLQWYCLAPEHRKGDWHLLASLLSQEPGVSLALRDATKALFESNVLQPYIYIARQPLTPFCPAPLRDEVAKYVHEHSGHQWSLDPGGFSKVIEDKNRLWRDDFYRQGAENLFLWYVSNKNTTCPQPGLPAKLPMVLSSLAKRQEIDKQMRINPQQIALYRMLIDKHFAPKEIWDALLAIIDMMVSFAKCANPVTPCNRWDETSLPKLLNKWNITKSPISFPAARPTTQPTLAPTTQPTLAPTSPPSTWMSLGSVLRLLLLLLLIPFCIMWSSRARRGMSLEFDATPLVAQCSSLLAHCMTGVRACLWNSGQADIVPEDYRHNLITV
jgi:hypothetical protein